MVYRQMFAFAVAALVTFALLWVMQLMISTGREALVEAPDIKSFVNFVRVEPKPLEPPPRSRPEPPQPLEQRPQTPQTSESLPSDTLGISHGTIRGPEIPRDGRISLAPVADGNSLSLVRPQPSYPLRATERGIEGWCEVEFAVTARGTVADARILACSHQLFEATSLQAVAQWRYRPRVVNGQPVEERGVRTRFVFELDR